jgi:hypothetical protein
MNLINPLLKNLWYLSGDKSLFDESGDDNDG